MYSGEYVSLPGTEEIVIIKVIGEGDPFYRQSEPAHNKRSQCADAQYH